MLGPGAPSHTCWGVAHCPRTSPVTQTGEWREGPSPAPAGCLSEGRLRGRLSDLWLWQPGPDARGKETGQGQAPIQEGGEGSVSFISLVPCACRGACLSGSASPPVSV